MRANRPELRIITATILLGTLALALAVIIGWAWWDAQSGLTHHAQEKVDMIAQFLENGMALLPEGGADLEGLHILMERVGEENGARWLEIARGAPINRQYGPSASAYVPDDLAHQVFQSGQDITVVESQGRRRVVRHLKVLKASESCLGCHQAEPETAREELNDTRDELNTTREEALAAKTEAAAAQATAMVAAAEAEAPPPASPITAVALIVALVAVVFAVAVVIAAVFVKLAPDEPKE